MAKRFWRVINGFLYSPIAAKTGRIAVKNNFIFTNLMDLVTKEEKKHGKHPTQKPLALLERIILASTNEGDLVLDPFNGSGTTGLVSVKLNRRYIGIDKELEYCELTKKRYFELINKWED